MDDDFTPPAVVVCPDVAYPAGIDRGPQAVEVTIGLDEHGVVTDLKPVTGEEPFLGLVTDALFRCTFTPATENGDPIPVELPFRWDFAAPPVNVAVLVQSPDGPLAGAPVTVAGRDLVTGPDGRVSLVNLAPGTYEVRVGGDWRGAATFDLALGEVVDLTLAVIPVSAVPEAVGTWSDSQATIVRRVLSKEEIRALPGTMGDAVRALQNAPGLVRTPFDAGWLIVRGGDIDDTGVFLDGVRIPLLFHLGGLTSALHPELVDEVHLLPAAFPARYGQSLSGIAELSPAAPSESVRFVGGVNLAFSHAFVEAPIGPGSLAVAARRSYLDAALAAVLDRERARIAPKFMDGTVRYESDAFAAWVVAMSDVIDTPADEAGETVRIVQDALQGHVRLASDLGGSRLETRAWTVLLSRSLDTSSRDEIEWQLTPGVRFEVLADPAGVDLDAGLEAETRSYYVERDAGTGLKVREGRYGHGSPFLEAGVGEDLRVEGGVRLATLFVTDQLPRADLSPRAAVRWQARPRFAVVGELGRVHQPPPGLFLVGFDEGAYLPLERCTFTSGGVRWADPRVAVDADVWHREMREIAGIELDGTFGDLQGRASGVELLTRVRLASHDLRVVVQGSRTERREEPGDRWVPGRYDQPVLVQVAAIHHLPKQWTLSERFRYGSGYPLADGVSSAYDILRQLEVPLDTRDDRLPAYHALDVRFAKRFTTRHTTVDAYLDIENAYSHRVAEPAINGIDDTEPVYGFGLPILPIFGVDVAWSSRG